MSLPGNHVPASALPAAPLTSGADMISSQRTVCAVGDGYVISELSVNSSTSCEFALAVLHAQTAELHPTFDSLSEHLKRLFRF